MTLSVLVVDNYDSFVFNLAQYLQQLRCDVTVIRNDEVPLDTVTGYDGVLLSPGPGTPADSGVCPRIIEEFGPTVPILGVCLGHQAIAEVYGGVVDRAPNYSTARPRWSATTVRACSRGSRRRSWPRDTTRWRSSTGPCPTSCR